MRERAAGSVIRALGGKFPFTLFAGATVEACARAVSGCGSMMGRLAGIKTNNNLDVRQRLARPVPPKRGLSMVIFVSKWDK
jgi:hypothetical protein